MRNKEYESVLNDVVNQYVENDKMNRQQIEEWVERLSQQVCSLTD